LERTQVWCEILMDIYVWASPIDGHLRLTHGSHWWWASEGKAHR